MHLEFSWAEADAPRLGRRGRGAAIALGGALANRAVQHGLARVQVQTAASSIAKGEDLSLISGDLIACTDLAGSPRMHSNPLKRRHFSASVSVRRSGGARARPPGKARGNGDAVDLISRPRIADVGSGVSRAPRQPAPQPRHGMSAAAQKTPGATDHGSRSARPCLIPVRVPDLRFRSGREGRHPKDHDQGASCAGQPDQRRRRLHAVAHRE